MTSRQALEKLHKLVEPALEALRYPLKINGQKLLLYVAGKKTRETQYTYNRIFGRDSLLSAILMKDARFLKDLLIFLIKTQGKNKDPFSGQELGKIIHEYPSVKRRGLSTEYNSVDATPLFLIGFYEYFKLKGDEKFVKENKASLNLALSYIISHTKDNIFWDDPKYLGAKRYALKATYWRDGGLFGRKNQEIKFPAAYALLQAQIIMALRAVANLAKVVDLDYSSRQLLSLAQKMAKALFNNFWHKERNYIVPAIDNLGKITTLYSDGLTLLYFLESKDVPKDKLKGIVKAAKIFETPFGYLTYQSQEPTRPHRAEVDAVWPWEQAYIALAGLKHNQKELAEKSLGTVNALVNSFHPFTEYFYYRNGGPKPGGCYVQLWTIAYVEAMYSLRLKRA